MWKGYNSKGTKNFLEGNMELYESCSFSGIIALETFALVSFYEETLIE